MASSSRPPEFSAFLASATGCFVPGRSESPVNTAKFLALAESMVCFATDSLSLSPALVHKVEILSAGMRSVVLRVGCANEEQSGVIVKFFRRKDGASNSGGFGYLREKHGLKCLNLLGNQKDSIPSFSRGYASNDSLRMLLIEDVPGIPLAEGLFSPERALLALECWVDFWIRQLTSPAQSSAQEYFRELIQRADPLAKNPGSLTSPRLVFKGLEKYGALRGLNPDSLKARELRGQISQVLAPTESSQLVLTSGDFSPHNLLWDCTEHTVRGIDAEGSAIHHQFLPLAELLLGFPSAPHYPRYMNHLSEKQWLAQGLRLYQAMSPDTPESVSAMMQDSTLRAAVITVICTLAEQGQTVSLPRFFRDDLL